ncbi:MAG: GNAT family N-acetyltransferase [Nitrosopumilus sp.]|nr:GNAT family N-acetyltransferase [Nitrosopumilus sp.]
MITRRAVPGDVGTVRRICRRIYPRGDYVEDALGSWIRAGSLYVAEEGKMRGIFALHIEGDAAWLHGARVDPGFQGMGHGTAMYLAAEGLARGAARMRAFAAPRGSRILEKLGYRRISSVGAFVAGDGAEPSWDGFSGPEYDPGISVMDSWMMVRGGMALSLGSLSVSLARSRFTSGVSLTLLRGDPADLWGYVAPRIDARGKAAYRWWTRLEVLCAGPDPGLARAGFQDVGRYALYEKAI